jgi:hypothetical protein
MFASFIIYICITYNYTKIQQAPFSVEHLKMAPWSEACKVIL